jgi:hypothetical protein
MQLILQIKFLSSKWSRRSSKFTTRIEESGYDLQYYSDFIRRESLG